MGPLEEQEDSYHPLMTLAEMTGENFIAVASSTSP